MNDTKTRHCDKHGIDYEENDFLFSAGFGCPECDRYRVARVHTLYDERHGIVVGFVPDLKKMFERKMFHQYEELTNGEMFSYFESEDGIYLDSATLIEKGTSLISHWRDDDDEWLDRVNTKYVAEKQKELAMEKSLASMMSKIA